jgi:DNA-binding Lrp family transcriptional regulator
MLAMAKLDGLDARIILELDKDPEATILSLSRTLGVARNTVHARLRRLSAEGVLLPFSRRVLLGALGYKLVAFVSLSISQSTADEVRAALLRMPEVVEVHYVTGDADLLTKVVATDTDHLHRLTLAILAINGVQRSSTAVSLAEMIPYRPDALLEATARTWTGTRGR